MKVDPGGPPDADEVMELASRHPFARLRALKRFGLDVSGVELGVELVEALSDDQAMAMIGRDGGALVACAAVEPLAFETEVFGFSTGRLSEVVVAGPTAAVRVQRATQLVSALSQAWADNGGRLLIGGVDADDHAALVGVQDAGFRVLEACTTFFADNDNVPAHRQRHNGFVIRRYSKDEVSAVPAASLAQLQRWVARSYSHGHLHADARMPAGAADAFYSAWTRNTFAGEYGDVVYAAWKGDDVVGFLSWLRRQGFEQRHGVQLLAPGLGAAVAPIGRGAFGDMYATVTTDRPLGARLVEHSTQLSNFAVHAAYARFPVLRLDETHFVVHWWAA